MGFLTDLFAGGASQLVDSIGNALDKNITTTEEKMQLELEMKKADWQFQTEMRKLSVEEKQLVFQDIDSARKMASAVQTSPNASKLSKNVSPILALGTTLLTFVLFYLLIFQRKQLEENNSKEIVLYILGVLSAIITQVYSFYFGSSQGSSDKNQIIQSMREKADAAKN